jgi:bifunctional non-homologous end joining protein LigD
MVIKGAQRLREFLVDLGLVSFVKTTGGKGLHVVVPITRRQEWDEAKAFCRSVTEAIVRQWPTDYTANMSKAQRTAKVFIDYFRNDRGATSIAAYSTRARTGAPVSVPVDWDELSPKLHSDHFTIKNLPRRLQTLKRDPWADLTKTRQSITAAMLKKLRA